jgi:signal transduction histidine kinase
MRRPGASDLLNLSRRLQSASGFEDLVAEAQAEIRARLGYSNAWLFVWEDESLETGRLLAVRGDKEADVWTHAPILKTAGDAMLEEIVRGERAVVVADALTDPRTNKDIVAKLQNRTIINVPLRLLDNPLGALGCGTFGDEGCRPPNDEELDFLIQIAAHLSVAAGRIRLGHEKKLRAQERLEVDRKLDASQRLERLGLLAGGIAHDFNNLLTAMVGAAQLIGRGPLTDVQRADLGLVLEVGERAAELVGQLLATGSQSALKAVVTDVNCLIEQFACLGRRMVPANVELDFVAGMHLPRVLVDGRQIEQLLMNLLLNARDAMPNGGRVTVETEQVLIEGAYGRLHPWAKRGYYVLVSVTDNGAGMTAEVAARIFEPFFTTKPEGHGTGLGLAVAYGIARHHDGMLQCYSEPGVGTTFKIYLPAHSRAAASVETKLEGPAPTGSEHALLAEDQGGP